MRWLYADPNRPEERAYVQESSHRIDSWWRSFAARASDLAALFEGKKQWDLPGWMHETLQAIHPELMWEYGPAVRGNGHRLVITPESARALRPLVDTLLQRAPVLDGWEFYAHRLPESVEMALISVEARVGLMDIEDAQVEVWSEEHQRVGLRFRFEACTSDDDREARDAAFVATESLLGEASLDQWIGTIEVTTPEDRTPAPTANRVAIVGLAGLRREVETRIDQFRASLPAEPCLDRLGAGKLWKLEPPTVKDCPRQEDLFVAKSFEPAVWLAAHSDRSFDSSSFSRHGEQFCYVKLDGSEGLDEEHFADKGEIEDALDEPLHDARAGCVIGGGTGLRYSYIDLALLDVERGIDIVRDVLRRGNITRRAWILFFDTSLSAEWVGVWPDSPEPMMGE